MGPTPADQSASGLASGSRPRPSTSAPRAGAVQRDRHPHRAPTARDVGTSSAFSDEASTLGPRPMSKECRAARPGPLGIRSRGRDRVRVFEERGAVVALPVYRRERSQRHDAALSEIDEADAGRRFAAGRRRGELPGAVWGTLLAPIRSTADSPPSNGPISNELALRAKSRPGSRRPGLEAGLRRSQRLSVRRLRRGLEPLGLVVPVPGALSRNEQVNLWFPHGPTHGIGIDVHDPSRGTRPGGRFRDSNRGCTSGLTVSKVFRTRRRIRLSSRSSRPLSRGSVTSACESRTHFS